MVSKPWLGCVCMTEDTPRLADRYATRRLAGGWCVVELASGRSVAECGPGPAGAAAAEALAAEKNLEPALVEAEADVELSPMEADGRELRMWRKRHRLTQQGLADRLGVRVLTVIRWEAGLHPAPGYLQLALERLDQVLYRERREVYPRTGATA